MGSVVPKTGGAPTPTTPRDLLHRVTGVRVMCPCYKVYASQWLRPKKLRIFESEGVESTENVEMGNQSIVQTMTMPNFKARKAESEKRSKREARAFAFLSATFCCLFSLKGRASVAGPRSFFCRLSLAALLLLSEERPDGL